MASPRFFLAMAFVGSVSSGVEVTDSVLLGVGDGIGEESRPPPKSATYISNKMATRPRHPYLVSDFKLESLDYLVQEAIDLRHGISRSGGVELCSPYLSDSNFSSAVEM